jgi:hypothetical protein
MKFCGGKPFVRRATKEDVRRAGCEVGDLILDCPECKEVWVTHDYDALDVRKFLRKEASGG